MIPSPLTSLQVEATRLFFSLPDSAGFAVAGGAALIGRIFVDMLATIDRLTDDDLLTEPRQASAIRAYMRDWADELTAIPDISAAQRQLQHDAARQDPEHA